MVRFRVKLFKQSFTVVINSTQENENNDLTLQALKREIGKTEAISQNLCGSEFDISLNGKDALTGDERTLRELGLVSGDLIRLIVKNSASQNAPDQQRDIGACSKDPSQLHVQQSDDRVSKATENKPSRNRNQACRSISPHQEPSTSGASMEPETEEAGFEMEEETVQDNQAQKLMNEPMLVRESTPGSVPQQLLLTYTAAEVTNSHEAVFVVMHVLMIETGFCSSNHNYNMPDGWRKPGGVFKTQYTVAGDVDKTVSLTYVTLGDKANVVCTVCVPDIKYQLQLNPAEFVLSVCQSACDTFKNLPRLSTVFKDKISYAALQSMRSGTESPLPSLTNLMAELQLLIMKNLSAVDLLHLSAVNRHFNSITREKVLWRRLYMKDFGRRTDGNDLSQDWMKLYKQKYVLRKQMRENLRLMRSEMPPPPFRDPFADPYPLHPGPGYPPGFVGGDYDRDPTFGGLPGVFGPGGGPQPPLMLPRPRYDPIGPYPDMRRPQRPPLPGWSPRFGSDRRDPGFGGGGFGFI